MQRCPRCSHKNLDGVLICERCRQPFNNHIGLATRQMRAVIDMDESPLPAHHTTVAAPVQVAQGKLTIQLEEPAHTLVVQNVSRIIIGRSSTHSVRVPDVDLAPYNAFSKGVSSLHASIFLTEEWLNISDLGSLNGTYLNREGLTPHIGYRLRSGDLVYLGQMAMRVFY